MRLWAFAGRITYWLAWPFLWAYLRLDGERTRVAVVCGDQLLLTKGWLGSGRWALPGGGLHRGEEAIAGALRELREETGLTLQPSQLQFHSEGNLNRNGPGFRYQLFIAELKTPAKVRPQRGEILITEWVGHATLHANNAESAVLLAVHAWWG
ncbi:MAG TPA: NUDIX hydrolase [Candidatus Saccharimonadales bacterium]|nr:NUDIX hydrolase [Candidatus Saccharimonadales bacterium]